MLIIKSLRNSIQSIKITQLINLNYILLATLNAGLGYFYFGYNCTVLNPILKNLQEQFHWNSQQKYFYSNCLNTVIPLGGLIGSSMSGKFLQYYGRRQTLMINCFFSSIGNILTLIPDIYYMIIGRFIVGLGIGIFSVAVPQYVNEITPSNYQGLCGTIYHQLLIGSEFFSLALGIGLPDKEYDSQLQKIMLVLPIFTNFLMFILFYTIFVECTPLFYVQTQQYQKALDYYEKIYSKEDALMLLENLKIAQDLQNKHTKFSDIFKPKYRKMIKFGIALNVSIQCTGFTILMFYSNKILMENGDPISNQTASLFSSSYLLLSIIITFFLMKRIDKYPRQVLLVFGLITCMISVILIIICQIYEIFWAPKYLFYLFFIGFEIGPDNLIFVILTEILPEFGVSFCVGFQWLFQLILLFVVPYLIEFTALKFAWSFSIFVISTFCFSIYFWYNLPDSRAKNFQDFIQEQETFNDSLINE